jgi:hypothetical protein
VSRFGFYRSPPGGWDASCREAGLVFGSPGWQQLLHAGFGCDSVYAWNGAEGAAIAAFAAGPFSIGYLGFPAGSVLGHPEVLADMLAGMRGSAAVRLTCLRIPVSPFGGEADVRAPFVENPETAITDLQSWDLMRVSKNLRRDIRKAGRSGLEIEHTTDAKLAPTLFGMYESAVRHHGGSLRYNQVYFGGLLELAAHDPRVRVYIARQDSDVAGFAVVIYDAGTACYLHGGSTAEFRQLSPSDLILSEAITAARDAGQAVFNFMASPADQPSLVRYKEKWGAETRPLRTYTVPLSLTYPFFRGFEKLYRMVR